MKTALIATIFILCTIVDDNPLDETGSNYHPPTITIDPLRSTIKKDDTIHVDSVIVAINGNNKQSRFRFQLDTSLWSAWQDTGNIKYKNIAEGKHLIFVQSKYEGGTIIVSDTIAFFMQPSIIPIDTTHFRINIQTTSGGRINRSSTKSDYLLNEILTVKAVADSGFEFYYWDGDIQSVNDSLTITTNKNLTFRAVFSPIITGACRELAPGENISAAIRTVIATQKQGLLCVKPGIYNGRAVRITGNCRFI